MSKRKMTNHGIFLQKAYGYYHFHTYHVEILKNLGRDEIIIPPYTLHIIFFI